MNKAVVDCDRVMRISVRQRAADFSASRVPLLICLACALCIRAYFYVGYGYHDDFTYARFVESLLSGQPERPTWYDGARPGVYLPMTAFAWVFGYSERVLSLYFLLCSLTSVILVYVLAEDWRKGAGLWAAWALSIWPIDVIFSTQYGSDVPFATAGALCVLAALRSWRIESKNRVLWSIVLGLSLGWAYADKETIVVLFAVLVWVGLADEGSVFSLYRLVSKTLAWTWLGNCRAKSCPSNSQLRCSGNPHTSGPAHSIHLVVGTTAVVFLLCVLMYNLYFFALFGEWLLGEKVRCWTFAHDLVGNDCNDHSFYIRAMLNCDVGRWTYEHNLAYYGWMYYAFAGGVAVLIAARMRSAIAALGWWLIGFIFFEWGIGWVTSVTGVGIPVRAQRHLIMVSVPAAACVGLAFGWLCDIKYMKGICLAVALALSVVSLNQIHDSTAFTYQGMDDFRQVARILSALPARTVWFRNSWEREKVRFFTGYKLPLEQCRVYDEPASGTTLDSVTITHGYLVHHLCEPHAEWDRLPMAVRTNVTLLALVEGTTRGVFGEYDPRIYLVGSMR